MSLHDIDKRLYELGGGESIKQIASIDTRYSIRYDTGKSGIKQMNQHLFDKQYSRTKDELPYNERCAKAAEMTIAGFSAEEIADALKEKVYIDPATVLPQHFTIISTSLMPKPQTFSLPIGIATTRSNSNLVQPHRQDRYITCRWRNYSASEVSGRKP